MSPFHHRWQEMQQAKRTVTTGDHATAPWGQLWAALALSLLCTALLGGAALLLDQNVWWLAIAGTAGLFVGGVFLGWRCAEAEPFFGALLAILSFALTVVVLFGGTLADALPEPLPGLGIGDSTFFFVWPLLQLASAVAGCLAGGRMAASSHGAQRAEP